MANMDITQRTQLDRVDLSVPTTGVRVRDRRPVVAYMLLASATLATLAYAAIDVIQNWAGVVVLAGLVMLTVGVMIALDPLRRGA